MKRIFIIIACMIAVTCLLLILWKDNQDFYGTYTFEEVTWLSFASSSTKQYINEDMIGTKYIVESDLFKEVYKDKVIEVNFPKYVEGKNRNDLSQLPVGKQTKYTIYNKDGSETYMRLYISPAGIWIASYFYDGIGSENLMYLYKLHKQ